ncbi:hypothetical protein [Spirochaeta cellobiosiphila]|uniref:hypothetical protein n=1 Tax=Spirochaeta cellobiosiphila TaxID=504483 RepID=UPI0004060612|nr:hypothetical protein [Spirochaeta cellobiosiphila]
MKRITTVLIMFLVMLGMVSANGTQEGTSSNGKRTYTIFLGYEKENYPTKGTIFGNWLEEQTGVKLEWDILVGDLKQKIGIMAASGDYPDLIAGRNQTHVLYEAGAFIPLDDLLDQYGQDLLALWGDNIKLLRQDDGHIYWLPQTMPYGDKVRKSQEAQGLYIQKAVLEYYDYKLPENLEEAVDMLIGYAQKFPEINGNKTFAFTALTDGWREYAYLNTPSLFSGHPNDGKANVDMVNGRWTVSPIGFDEAAYKTYKLYNKIYNAGLYDEESFVMSYDQYTAKLTTGSILAFYDQWWNFDQPNTLLKEQGQGRWYVPTPTVLAGYPESYEGPIEPQSTEGVGISVNCKDPVGAIKYLNFLAKESTEIMRHWGREGTDYLVDEDGYFYRNAEMIQRFNDQDWVKKEFGADYWANMIRPDSANFYSDGKNSVAPKNQPSIYKAKLRPGELEALEALGVDTFYELFNKPDQRRASYYPAWSINYPTGSDIAITDQKITDVRREYTPKLIMAAPGEYDKIWKAYLAEYNAIPKADRDSVMNYLQKEIDKRVEINGGY